MIVIIVMLETQRLLIANKILYYNIVANRIHIIDVFTLQHNIVESYCKSNQILCTIVNLLLLHHA